jgi:centromere protein C
MHKRVSSRVRLFHQHACSSNPMPTSARKSSIGGRRGLQKAHIPYRGDNPEVGKKTGIAVQHVERKSDGFEPFEELMQRADGLTPPQRRGRKKSSASVHQQEMDYEEEDGEQSMQLDSE